MTVRTIKPADISTTDTYHGENIDYLEYGIQLPNGAIWWGSHFTPNLRGVEYKRLNLQVIQEQAQRAYAEHIEREGIAYDPKQHSLRFVSRRQQIRFTEPETLVGEELQEFPRDGEVS